MANDFELPKTATRGAKSSTGFVEPKAPDAAPPKAEEPKQTSSQPKYSEEELLRVFDDIIFTGEYEESYVLRGKVKVTFRTRNVDEINKIQFELDSSNFQLISSVEQKRSVLTLEYALKTYHDKDLSTMTAEQRREYVKKLPGPIVGAMLEALTLFDNKVFQACKEGEANF